MKRKFLLLSVLVLSVALLGRGEASDVKVIKYANVGAADTAGNLVALEMIDYLEKISGGKMRLELYANSALGNNREIVEGIQLGSIEMATPSTAILGGFTNSALVFDLPYLFKSYESAADVLGGDTGKSILAELESSGIMGMGWSVNGWRHLTANKPIHHPSEMKGLKIRVMETQMHIDHFNAIGASAIPMSFSEVYTSLQQGVIDCQENPFITGTGAKLEEVQKYWMKTGHIFDASPVLVSKVFWDGLNDEEKGWVRDLVDTYIPVLWERCREAEQKIEDRLRNNGFNVIVELSPSEKAEFRAAAQPVYDKYRNQIGGDLIDKIEKAQEKY
ncbi:C4-dicarboxylate ABC transporter substrate-binding protein [Synergistales bacterium]|nr:C4-dicarboxylate ABC transporter substrate-binding protein [Synergistales bacterium]